MGEHAPEPWQVFLDNFGLPSVHTQMGFARVARVDMGEENAHRIVACVNACQGIPNGALELKALTKLIAACRAIAEASQERLELGLDELYVSETNMEQLKAAIAHVAPVTDSAR